MADTFETVGFVGAGRTATALAIAFSGAGYVVGAVASRSLSSAQLLAGRVGARAADTPEVVVRACDVVFLTVPDDAVAPVAASLPWRQGQGAVHCGGALPLDVLAVARARGAQVGSFHPFQTFPKGDSRPGELAGVTFAMEGEGPLRRWLEEAAHRLGGHVISVAERDRPLYHASAVVSCGFVMAMVETSCRLWDAMGFSREEALRAMVPLLEGTVRSIAAQGLRLGGLTGPFVRGDVGTVRRHLEALASRAPGALPLYCHAGQALASMAWEEGAITQERARELSQLLTSYLATSQESEPPEARRRR